jgi:hypothetical protein
VWFYDSSVVGLYPDSTEPDENGDPTLRYLGGPCTNMSGNLPDVYVVSGYASTITLSGATAMTRLWLESGVIDQAGHDLTITGPGAEWSAAPADFYWTGGTITGSGDAAAVTVVGDPANYRVTTALVTGAVTLGSNLVFDAGAEAEVDAQVNMTNPTGIDVLGGSGLTLANGTALLSALTAIEERQTIRVFGEHSRLFTRGAATADLGLWVGGGTAEFQGVATGEVTVTFAGAVRQANGDPAPGLAANNGNSVYMTSGSLIIGEGARLATGPRSILVRGGKLATRVTAGRADHTAFISTQFLIIEQAAGATTEIVIGDPSMNPPGVNGYVYSTLYVTGPVAWKGGAYRPLLNPNNNWSSLWYSTGNFHIGDPNNPGAAGPVLGPTSGQQLPPVNRTYEIIMSGTGLVRNTTPALEAGNTNWAVLPGPINPNDPDRVLTIKRT